MIDAAAAAAPAMPPSARYAEAVGAGSWRADAAQARVMDAFDRLWRDLVAAKPPRWWRSFGTGENSGARGIYLWGKVGRGKTMLCEVFFESLPFAEKRRVHFHRFMREIHAELRSLDGRADPLVAIAARYARDTRVLVLDEFQVGDIGDAMILGNLLGALFARGVALVTTSNTPPSELYKDGLQRERFLPAIAAIEQHCEIIELASSEDFRLRALKQAPVYYTPLGTDAERQLKAAFARVAHGARRDDFLLDLNDRAILVRAEAGDAIWFDFTALCDGPRAVADYIELAQSYHALVVAGVPQFTPQTEDAARRFIELVDEVYDRGVKLIVSAAVAIIDLYDGERLRAEFARTQSRLIEMQSADYLARGHRA